MPDAFRRAQSIVHARTLRARARTCTRVYAHTAHTYVYARRRVCVRMCLRARKRMGTWFLARGPERALCHAACACFYLRACTWVLARGPQRTLCHAARDAHDGLRVWLKLRPSRARGVALRSTRGMAGAAGDAGFADKAWRSSRGRQVAWSRETCSTFTDNFLAAIPAELTDLIRKGEVKRGPLIKFTKDDDMKNAGLSLEPSEIENNILFVEPVAEAFPESVPSAYFLADAFLMLDERLAGRLLPGDNAADKMDHALADACRLKKCMQKLRYLCRATSWESATRFPALHRVKSLLRKRGGATGSSASCISASPTGDSPEDRAVDFASPILSATAQELTSKQLRLARACALHARVGCMHAGTRARVCALAACARAVSRVRVSCVSAARPRIQESGTRSGTDGAEELPPACSDEDQHQQRVSRKIYGGFRNPRLLGTAIQTVLDLMQKRPAYVMQCNARLPACAGSQETPPSAEERGHNADDDAKVLSCSANVVPRAR